MLAKIKEDVATILIPRVKASMSERVRNCSRRSQVAREPHRKVCHWRSRNWVDGTQNHRRHLRRKRRTRRRCLQQEGPLEGGSSAAYATRHVAKNVAAGVCDEVLVQVAYAIGVADPVGLYVNTYGTSKVEVEDGMIAERIAGIFPMQPYHIEQRFKLRTPIYTETAAYGHMGRPSEVVTKRSRPTRVPKEITVELFPWEKLDKVEEVKQAFGL